MHIFSFVIPLFAFIAVSYSFNALIEHATDACVVLLRGYSFKRLKLRTRYTCIYSVLLFLCLQLLLFHTRLTLRTKYP